MRTPRLVVTVRNNTPTTAVFGGYSVCTTEGMYVTVADLFARLRLKVPASEQPIPVNLVEQIDTVLGIGEMTDLTQVIGIIDEDQAGRRLTHSIDWPETTKPLIVDLDIIAHESELVPPCTWVSLNVSDLDELAQRMLCADLLSALSGGPTAYYDINGILADAAWQWGGAVHLTEEPSEEPNPDNVFGCCGPLKKLYCPGRGPRVRPRPTCACED